MTNNDIAASTGDATCLLSLVPYANTEPTATPYCTSIPKKGKEHDPGLVGVTLASGSITCPPVSVCQKVSTMWHLPLPTWLTVEQGSGLGVQV